MKYSRPSILTYLTNKHIISDQQEEAAIKFQHQKYAGFDNGTKENAMNLVHDEEQDTLSQRRYAV